MAGGEVGRVVEARCGDGDRQRVEALALLQGGARNHDLLAGAAVDQHGRDRVGLGRRPLQGDVLHGIALHARGVDLARGGHAADDNRQVEGAAPCIAYLLEEEGAAVRLGAAAELQADEWV